MDYCLKDLIIYQDDEIIVINKPSGLRTIPDGYQTELPNLRDLLLRELGKIWVVHRLDKETSGIILFALNKEVHRYLNIQFENRLVRKEYTAITHHIPGWESYIIDAPLKVNGDRKHRTIVSRLGKPATTEVKILKSNLELDVSLINAYPKSGYTHQIRAHLSHINLPILQDSLYHRQSTLSPGETHANGFCSRLALHASRIEFDLGMKRQEFRSSLPDEFDHIISQ